MRTPPTWLLPAALGLSTCSDGGHGAAEARQLHVCAATSTRDALSALAEDFERAHGVELVLQFGSSGDLARQIVAAPGADVFLSADEREMDRVADAGLVLAGTRAALLSNQLVVVEPTDGPSRFTQPFDPAQLAAEQVELLALGHVETVPAGRYAKAWLERRGLWSSVERRVLPGVDARAALAAVESGGAQAGIVYRTDAARSTRVRVLHAVPLDEGPPITYPLAVIARRPREELARAFVEHLRSPTARTRFEALGFVVLADG
jgi:molybdate transport system substrate-binding protein